MNYLGAFLCGKGNWKRSPDWIVECSLRKIKGKGYKTFPSLIQIPNKQHVAIKKAIIPKVSDKVYDKISKIGLEIKQVSKVTDAIIQGLKQE